MAHDVNQGERDVAAQVRSALVSRISAERLELWIPDSTKWSFQDGALTLLFESDFSCQLARQMLSRDFLEVLQPIAGPDSKVWFERAVQTVHPPIGVKPGSIPTRLQGESALAERGPQSPASKICPGNATLPLGQFSAQRSANEISAQGDSRKRVPEYEGSSARFAALASVPRSTTAKNGTNDHCQQFVHGESNQLAWAAAKLIVADPGRMTPVFLHGPSGVGKSLLVASIAEQLRTVRRLPRVVHMSSEQFLNDFTDGLRCGGLPMFRRKYREVEALVLEDIQFFIGKKSSIAEVKHTLDNLLRLGKQVVFTADRSLNELGPLGSDLVGRIRGGLTAPLFPLDEKTRHSILKREIAAASVEMDEQIIGEISRRVTGDGRVLSGIVKRLAAVAAFDSLKLDWDRCWSAIADLVQATQPVVRIVDIERVVCDVFGLEPDSLQSQSKIRRVSQPRMLAMFLARKYTPAAYKEIGQYFGRRRHSTVISAEKTVECWLVENADLEVGRGFKVRDAIRHVESQLQVG